MNGDEKMNEKEDNIGLWIILIFLVLGFFNFCLQFVVLY